ncbi:MAG: 3-hydroxyacyl-CoA dehydrogenase NAD-binding domain-containing protein [Desulfobacteraceae bacterium]|nr:3-hydroxyacyl-CoA dehydrogenase NAD-binding domain-containing protein [Desulfobacteraceae bacterium]
MSQISKIGVIGAGHMGSGIAQKIAQEGMNVVLVDIKPEYVEKGLAGIKSLLEGGMKRKIFTQDQVDQTLGRIQGTTDLKAVADADLVIEAVFEDRQVKTQLFQNLDQICGEKTIFATNTSSFYVAEFAAKIKRPDRFIGLHYFFHPAKNKLLEIIPHTTTSPDTVEKAKDFAARHGKTAIVVKDSPGFAVNRFFVPSSNEAARMLEEGLGNLPTVEEGSKRAFGIGMGSFEILNVTGIPLAVHASKSLGDELGLFYGTPDIMKTQMDKNEDWDLKAGEIQEDKIQAIVDRFYGICLGVAATIVDEGVATMEDLNLGAKIGLRWSKGPFEIMNHIGIDETCRVVEAMTQKYPGFKMPRTLLEQKKLGKPFTFKVVNLEIKEDTAWITINRPDAMNALNEAVVEQLTQVFDAAEKDPRVKSMVFQGAGKTFVAGADIQFFVDRIKAGRIQDIEAFTRKGHELLLRIENCPKKTIALLDGLSLGGGSELALACQYIVATKAGSMGFPETGIGIIPGLGGMIRMERRVGIPLAKYYVFTGRSLSAQDALDLGIVTQIVEPSAVGQAVREITGLARADKYQKRPVPEKFQALAKVFTDENINLLFSGKPMAGLPENLAGKLPSILEAKSMIALKMADDIMNKQAKMSIPEAVECELGVLDRLFSTHDAFEGLSTVGLRKPVFKGE